MKNRTAFIFGLVLSWVALQLNATASPILYTFSGIGSGSLGGTPFANAAFTVSLLSDTTEVIEAGFTGGKPIWSAESSLTTFTISGRGSGTFTLGTRVFNSGGTQTLGLSQSLSLGGFDAWDFTNPAFFDYDLQQAFGPISNVHPSLFSASMVDEPTTLGNLTFSPTPTVTFLASLVPEPSIFALLAAAVFALCHARKARVVLRCAEE